MYIFTCTYLVFLNEQIYLKKENVYLKKYVRFKLAC